MTNTTTKGLYTVNTLSRDASGRTYPDGCKMFYYLTRAVEYYFNHCNDGAGVYLMDERSGEILLGRKAV